MAIVVEGKADRATVGAGTTFTLTIACGTNANRFVLVGFSHQIYSGNISSITCNGNAMTSVYQDSATARLSLYKIVGDSNIATGDNVISVTIDTDRDSEMGAVSFSGVDQTTPNRAVSNAGGNSATPTVSSIVSVSGELLFWIGNEIDSRTISNLNGQTAQWNRNIGFGKGWGATITSTSSSETMTFTLNQSATWKAAAISITPVSGGATPINATPSDGMFI